MPVARASLLAVSMKKCLLPIHRLVGEVSPKILRKLPYFLLPMTQRGLRVIKFPFRVVCMVFKFITFSSRAGGRRRSMRPSS